MLLALQWCCSPIIRGQDADATELEQTRSTERLTELLNMCNTYMLRRCARTSSIANVNYSIAVQLLATHTAHACIYQYGTYKARMTHICVLLAWVHEWCEGAVV